MLFPVMAQCPELYSKATHAVNFHPCGPSVRSQVFILAPFVVSVNVDSYLTGKRHRHMLIHIVQTYSHFRRLSSFFILILASLSHHHILINKNREVIIVFKKIFLSII